MVCKIRCILGFNERLMFFKKLFKNISDSFKKIKNFLKGVLKGLKR